MRNKFYIFTVLVFIFLAMLIVQEVWAAENKEYQIKAAFLYNFIKFTDWPEEKMGDSNEPIVVGIIGKDPFGDSINVIRGERVKNRELIIKWFKSFEESEKSDGDAKASVHKEIESIKKCHLLFFCPSEKKKT